MSDKPLHEIATRCIELDEKESYYREDRLDMADHAPALARGVLELQAELQDSQKAYDTLIMDAHEKKKTLQAKVEKLEAVAAAARLVRTDRKLCWYRALTEALEALEAMEQAK